jgi:hypothetical protein
VLGFVVFGIFLVSRKGLKFVSEGELGRSWGEFPAEFCIFYFFLVLVFDFCEVVVFWFSKIETKKSN